MKSAYRYLLAVCLSLVLGLGALGCADNPPPEPPPPPPPAPAASLPVISAILLSDGRRLAVVDGRVLGAGQRAGPWELVSVDRDAVVLRDASGAEQVVTLGHE